MIKYIKENLESIGKLFINHIGMMIFSLVVMVAGKMINAAVFYAAGVLAVLMYFSLVYTAMWERGAKDKIRVDGGRVKQNLMHGLFLYLIANCIAVVMGFISLIFAFFVTEDASFVNGVYGVTTIIAHYYSGMYLPITEINGLASMPVVYALVHFALVIPGALVSFVSYILGVKGFKCIFPEGKREKNKKIR